MTTILEHPFHASNCMTLPTELVHMVEIVTIAHGRSWNLRRRSWMKKGEEVRQY